MTEHYDLDLGRRRARWFLALVGVSILSVFVRWPSPTRRSPWFWDEGIFLMGARFLRWRFDGGQVIGGGEATMSLTDHVIGFPTVLWKPLYVGMTALSTLVFGDSFATIQGQSIALAAMTVFGVGVVGWLLRGPWTGIFGASFLALSQYHRYYSLTGLSETAGAAALFLSIGLFLLVLRYWDSFIQAWPRPVLLLLAGVLFGVAFGMSYRTSVFAPGLGIGSLLWLIVREREGLTTRRGFLFSGLQLLLFPVGMFLVFGGMEVLMQWAFAPPLDQVEFNSYFGMLQAKFAGETAFDFKHPFHYFVVLAAFNGWVWVGLLVVSSLVVSLKGGLEERLLVLLIVVPFVLFSLTEQRLTRVVSPLSPMFALLIGIALPKVGIFVAEVAASASKQELVDKKVGGILGSMVVLAIVLPLGFLSDGAQLSQQTSGHAEAISKVVQLGGNPRHVSTMWPVTAYLSSKRISRRVPQDPGELRRLYDLGYRFVLMDWQDHQFPGPVTRGIKAESVPVAAVPNPYAGSYLVHGENHLPEDWKRMMEVDPFADKILIYDLRDIFERSASR